MAIISRGTGSVLFRGMNSFWKRLFRDSVVIDSLYEATEVAMGDVYLDLMESVLSKSLRNTPVFSKRDWKLLLLTNTDLSFDPPVYSQDSTDALGPVISVIAQELNRKHDGVVFELSDSFNMSSEKRKIYPGYGVFNVGLVDGVLAHERLWVAVVPTGKTVYQSIRELSRRLVTAKRPEVFVAAAKNSIQDLDYQVKKALVGQGDWDASANLPALPPAALENRGHFYEVAVAGSTEIDGVSSWAEGDYVVSTGEAWVKAPLELPTLVLRYGTELVSPIVLASGDYTDVYGLRDALAAAIADINATLAIPLDIEVGVDGGYITLTADKDLLAWHANTAFESLFFIKSCRFSFVAEIPPGREAEFMWNQSTPIQLLTGGYREAGTEYRFPISDKYKAASYIYNTLYQPSLALEQNRHYRISGGYIYFKDNPFDLDRVAFRDFGNGTRQLAMWMSDVSVDTLDLYYNYGYRFTKLLESSEVYKRFIQGLMYYYTHGPQHSRLISAFNIIAGIPVAADEDEMVLSVAPNGLTVVTDKNTYELGAKTPASVQVGDVLQAFDALTETFVVEDYINSPNWYDKMVIPDFLMPKAPLGMRVSSVTTYIPNVGDAGYVIGDLTTDAASLVTNPIKPAGSDYSLPAGAYFVIERDNNKKEFRVYVPPEITTGAGSLSAMAAYLRIAMQQFIGNPVNTAGAAPYRLLTDATFYLTHDGTKYPVTVAAADTAAVTTFSELVGVVQGRLDAALGSGKVQVFPYLENSSLVFIPTTNVPIAFSDLNIAARSELGLLPFNSLTGVNITIDGSSLVFTSATQGSGSRVRISDMNQPALDYLHMEPFRQGSGDYIGDDGDPSPGWNVMDKYLKYNTFRIRYDADAVTFSEDMTSLQEIVLSGRPLYTAAIVAPEFTLSDTIEGHGEHIEDIEAFYATISEDDVIMADQRVFRKAAANISEPYGQYYRRNLEKTYNYDLLAEPESVAEISGVSTDGGTVRFQSKTGSLEYVDHFIQLTDSDNLTPEDATLLSGVGIYNRGKVVDGVVIQAALLPTGTIGGVYNVNMNGDSTWGHWVQGFEKADLDMSATHVFVVDSQMKAAGFDPFAQGIAPGHFLKLAHMGEDANNGEFAILNMFRDVPFRDLTDGGEPVLVDLLVYRNNRRADAPEENYAGAGIPSGATVAFRSSSRTVNNSWVVVLSNTGTVSARIADVLAATGDDKDIFPFDIDYLPAEGGDAETWVPQTPDYYQTYSHGGNKDSDPFFGHLYKVSWDTNADHDDTEAQTVDGGGQLPHGYTQDLKWVKIIRGNANWGQETWDLDADPVGQVSRNPADLSIPYLLGQDPAGADVYVDYDHANKLDRENYVAMGEMAFRPGIIYHFTDEAPADKAEYYGANLNIPVLPLSLGPTVWPAGDTSTYRSFIWRGYWLAPFNLIGEYQHEVMPVIGGGALPGEPAPPGCRINTPDTTWTLEVGKTLLAVQGHELPDPLPANENDQYTVLLRHDSPYPGVDAPAEAGHTLFEHRDWIFNNGTNWVRKRHIGTYSEHHLYYVAKRLLDAVIAGFYEDDPYTAVIGAGYILNHDRFNHNYLIWSDGSRWTRVIGGSVVGNVAQGGYYDHLGPREYYGYGPTRVSLHSILTDLAHTELSSVFDWSEDTALGDGPAYPFMRVVEGPGYFTAYLQVSEQSLETNGVTISKIPGTNFVNAPDAVKLHYFDQEAQNWATPTNAILAGGLITGDDFTVRVMPSPGGNHRLMFWDGLDVAYYRDAESADINPDLYREHMHGKVVIAVKFEYSSPFTSLDNYLQGVVIQRRRVAITAG